VLFSEPKIPQFDIVTDYTEAVACFSALQRAENSSNDLDYRSAFVAPEFQCSSASRKFLNLPSRRSSNTTSVGFSALQRAENSSIALSEEDAAEVLEFQCSSASRKFLNSVGLSACARPASVSVLFSEPKIPQCRAAA